MLEFDVDMFVLGSDDLKTVVLCDENGELPDIEYVRKSECDSLNDRLLMLNALEMTGVDNWGGYDAAMELLEEMRNG